MLSSWLRRLSKLIGANRGASTRGQDNRSSRRPGFRPMMEQLEDRLVPAVSLTIPNSLTVTPDGYVPVPIDVSSLLDGSQSGLTGASIDLCFDPGLALDPTDVQLGDLNDPSSPSSFGPDGSNTWSVTANPGGNSYVGELNITVVSTGGVIYPGVDGGSLVTVNVKANGANPGDSVEVDIAQDSQVVDDPLGGTPYQLSNPPVNNFGILQTITFGGGPTGGTFTLSEGSIATGAINYSSNPIILQTSIQAALNALPNVGAGNVSVSATMASTSLTPTVSVTFDGGFISGPPPSSGTLTFTPAPLKFQPMTGDGSGLVGGNGATASLTVSSPGFGPATSSTSGVFGDAKVISAPHFALTTPTSAVAGTPFNLTVVAQNANNSTNSNYAGTVQFTSSDSQLSSGALGGLPANYTFTNQDAGVHVFSVFMKSAGHPSLTVTDVASGANGTSPTIAVTAASVPARFAIGHPVINTAGSPFIIQVTALDQFSNDITNYTGTVHLTSSDPKALLAADATLTNGTGFFGVVLTQAGTPTITATDVTSNAITGSSAVTVVAGAVTKLGVVAVPTVAAGASLGFTVIAEDAFGNTNTAYTGTVHFSKSDTATISRSLADYTFVSADSGVHVFSSGTELVTAGPQTLTAMDTSNGNITGSAVVTVSSPSASRLTVSAPLSPSRETLLFSP